MFEKDGIVYSHGEADEIKIEKAKPLVGRILLLTFSNGEERLFDTTTLEGPVFEILDDEEIFNKPEIFHGIVTGQMELLTLRLKQCIMIVFHIRKN